MKNTKLLSMVLVMVMLFSLTGGIQTVSAAGPPSDFIFNSATGTITGYTGPGGAVVIPSSIGGVSVTAIGAQAFYREMFTSDTITSVIIPSGVTTIGFGAFGNRDKIAAITIPSTVTSIGDYAFMHQESSGRSSLSRVYFLGTSAVTTMGAHVFDKAQVDFKIYYESGKPGFAEPTSYGYPSAPFVPATHTLTYEGNGNDSGSVPVSISAITAEYITVSGNTGSLVKTGYQFNDWSTSTGAISGTNYASGGALVMGTEPVTLYASWNQIYTINKNVTGNGSVTVKYFGNEIDHALNSDFSFNDFRYTDVTVAPASGWKYMPGTLKYNDGVNDHLIDNSNGGEAVYTFPMPKANIVLSAEFALAYDISIGSLTGGSITASPSPAAIGEIVDLTITPDAGKQLKAGTLKYNDGSDHAITGTSFTMPAVNVTVTAEFETVPTNHNSGSNGGGGGTPAVPATTTTTTGNTTVATTATTAKTDANGGMAASVTGAQVTDAIGKAVKGAAAQGAGTEALIDIKVEGAGSATSVSTTIPQSAWSELSGSSADGLRISTPLASVTFDAAALDAIKGKAAGDIKITAALADTSGLTGAEKEAVAGRPVYDLTVASGSTTISDFGGGSATVSIPYKLSAGEDAGKIVIYYLTDSGELAMVQNCSYDAATGKVTFIAKHFSNYVVGYNNVRFSDVSGWYKDYVNYLAAREIISGTGNGTFNPNTNITRAQFVTILANLAGADLSGYTTSSFNDVSKTAWYSAAVQWAYAEGIATGAGGKFDPNANITRQDMAVMIMRYAEKAADYTLPATNKAITFTDSKDIGSYASDAVAAMQQAGIISGNSDGSFAPAANASRAQAAKMIALLQQGMI